MIQTLYQIGQAIKDDPDYEQYFQQWGNPFPGRDANVIVLEVKNRKFQKLSIEKLKTKNLKQYLYKLGSTKGRATNSVPTVPYINPDSSFGKVEQSIKSNGHDFISLDELIKVKEALGKLDISNDKPNLLTFKINGAYLGDIPELVEYFEDNVFETYYKKAYAKEESKASNYTCALSGKKTTVYGFVNSLGFTVNDDAYMRNGFDQSNSYKMFPVGIEALKNLNGIKSLVFTNEFSHKFSGKIKYLILPKFLSEDNELIKEIFKKFKGKQALNLYAEKKEKGIKGFINNADQLIQEIIEDEDLHRQDILYDILFYEGKQSQLSLYQQLTDVRPSRLERIVQTKLSVERFYAELTNFDDGKKQYIFRINLVAIQNFLLTEQGRNKTPHPYFFKLTEAIFYGQKVNKETFTRFLLFKFRKAFKEIHENKYSLQKAVRKGFTLLRFLEKLNIFNNKNSNNMEQTGEKVKLDVLGFIEQHPYFFRGDNNLEYISDFKKGAFFFGLLVARLSEIEGARLASRPFLKRLNNGRINYRTIQSLYEPLIKKLEIVYDEHTKFYKQIKPLAAHSLFENHKSFTGDEISFAVMLGYSLYNSFKPSKKQ